MPFGFGKDKWLQVRTDLTDTARFAKTLVPDALDDALLLLLGSTPALVDSLSPYLKHLSDFRAEEELAKFDPELVDACATQLLELASVKSGLLMQEWKLSVSADASDRLAGKAIPFLDVLVAHLLDREMWELLDRYNVGGLLASAAQVFRYSNISDDNVAVGGLNAALARGLYAQGLASFHQGQTKRARLAWSFVGIYQEDTADPTVALAQAALARLPGDGA